MRVVRDGMVERYANRCAGVERDNKGGWKDGREYLSIHLSTADLGEFPSCVVTNLSLAGIGDATHALTHGIGDSEITHLSYGLPYSINICPCAGLNRIAWLGGDRDDEEYYR